eukprot:1452345-Pyramimonas_sp.AAC.1
MARTCCATPHGVVGDRLSKGPRGFRPANSIDPALLRNRTAKGLDKVAGVLEHCLRESFDRSGQHLEGH